MRSEYKKVVVALMLLLVLNCQMSFCQFCDMYRTVTSATKGIEEEASWSPGGNIIGYTPIPLLKEETDIRKR